jgi:predicted Rossmann fold nucleotide-binding protein DprA/Smf involved in DNA uptake
MPPNPELGMLSEEESSLLQLLKQDEATQFDKLYKSSGLEIPRLSDLLLKLETGGWIRQLPGNLYIRTRK